MGVKMERKNIFLVTGQFLLFLFFLIILIAVPAVSSSDWTTKAVDDPKQFSNFYSRAIAIDSNRHPHIAYGEDYLYHAYYDGIIWCYETVDSAGGVGEYTSIAIDSLDKVHISYRDAINYDLKYATNASGSWVTETVDSAGSVGGYTSIAIDSLDKVHISYYGGGLKYATNASGSWVTEIVDSAGSVGGYTSIAIDLSDKVHISYFDDTNNDLKYATNALFPSPDIKANGSDGPVTITTADTLTVTAEFSAGSSEGENADWWVLADTPFGWYYYDVIGNVWISGMVVTYQGPLFDLSPYEVLNTSGLPTGTYTCYFGVDLNINGSIDMDQMYYDSVEVTITP